MMFESLNKMNGKKIVDIRNIKLSLSPILCHWFGRV